MFRGQVVIFGVILPFYKGQKWFKIFTNCFGQAGAPPPLLAPVGGCYHLLGPWVPLEGIRALCKIVMGGHQIDQNRGGSLFWSIYVSLVCPRLKSGRGSSKHSGSLLWSIWVNRGPPPPLLIPILVNLVPPPHHWALLWSIYCLPPSLIPIMVNLSSIGGCGIIIQQYSPYVAPVMVNLSSLGGQLTTIFDVYFTWHCCGYDCNHYLFFSALLFCW